MSTLQLKNVSLYCKWLACAWTVKYHASLTDTVALVTDYVRTDRRFTCSHCCLECYCVLDRVDSVVASHLMLRSHRVWQHIEEHLRLMSNDSDRFIEACDSSGAGGSYVINLKNFAYTLATASVLAYVQERWDGFNIWNLAPRVLSYECFWKCRLFCQLLAFSWLSV